MGLVSDPCVHSFSWYHWDQTHFLNYAFGVKKRHVNVDTVVWIRHMQRLSSYGHTGEQTAGPPEVVAQSNYSPRCVLHTSHLEEEAWLGTTVPHYDTNSAIPTTIMKVQYK